MSDTTSEAAAYFAWQERAACRTDGDPEWWFPSSGTSHAFTLKAKAICNRCPVRDTCLEFGWDEQGTWGGMSREERVTAAELGFTAKEVVEIRLQQEAEEANSDGE